MVAGINEALRLRLFGFSPDENYWPGATVPPEHGRRQYAFEFLFNGRLPAVGAINDAGFGELSFHVAINVREPEAVGADGCGFDVADAYASGWLERTLGVWLQNGGTSLKCRRQLLATLAEADIAANGYSDRGKLMM